MSFPQGGRIAQIGSLEVVPVFDGTTSEDPTAFYRVSHGEAAQRGFEADDWVPFRDLLDDDGLLQHAYGGFLVRTGDRVVLIDTGVGPDQIGPYGPAQRVIRGGQLLAHLAQLGVSPAEITDVVLTHLHPDHFGWATANGCTTFPNATVRCHALDWDHYVTKPGEAIAGFAAQLPGLAPHLETWDHDGPLLPGIDTQHAPGHTPGSTILVLSSGVERGLLLGDVVHCPVELVADEWASLGDVDRELARRTKLALVQELERDGTPAAGAHFPGLRFGRLLAGVGRRQWVV
ncbi:MAG TPA: MBL fold metallo-hydrolase [Acidimicrobiales bacterium]|nr:MBL fold metallo-hydrolase [Acidimicrobiales bacterium]